MADSPKITYTPDGVAREPGYYNPDNPYDTGRHNEQNSERNAGGRGSKMPGWDYDNSRPFPGAVLGDDGLYQLGGSGPGGGMPSNFDATSHPYYRQVKSILDAMSVAERANFRNQIQGILISFGLVPGNFVDKFGALDDVTKQLVQKNTDTKISRWARMLEGLQLQNTDLVNRLTAQGLRRSGARGAGLRRNQLGFDRESSDAIGSLLGNIGNMYGSYSNNEYQRQLQLANALAWVYQNYFTQGTSGPGGADPTKQQDTTGNKIKAGEGRFLGVQAPRDSTFYDNYFNYGYRGDLLF